MSDIIEWILETNVGEGNDAALRTLMVEMSDATQANEPGTLTYEWYLSEDGGTLTVIERYADSAAAMTHVGSFGANFAERFLGLVTPVRMVVCGPASDELRGALAGLGAEHMSLIGGFHR